MRPQARDSRIVKAEFDVWLAREMSFNNPPGFNIRRYRKYARGKKVKYTPSMLSYLDRMEQSDHTGKACRAVAIELGGKIRYVWRSDLLTRKEYDKVQEKQRSGLGMLRKKQ